jgi:hypothetical protein
VGNDAGQQSDADKGPDGCVSPLIHCSGAEAGVCTNLTNDLNHCGACGTACTAADAGGLEAGTNNPDSGIPLLDGGMVPTGPFWSLGTPGCDASTCNVACPPPMSLCSDGICYDTQNYHDHCGDCSTACMSTEYCLGGHCCATGTAYCAGSCIDVLSDVNNCGGCGIMCSSGDSCVGGSCVACSNTNVALTATATISGGGSTSPYLPSDSNDGVLETSNCNDFAWITAGNTAGTAWIQYTWTSAHKLTKMHMDTTSATTADTCGNLGRTLGAATIQWWNGSSWVTDGSVSAQLNDWDYTFTSPVTTTQVRLYAVYCTNTMGQTSNPIVFEWQVTGCN